MYALKLWPVLSHYADNGRIEIDNLAAERALRGIALRPANYLFAGANRGGKRAAAMAGLIETDRLNGIDLEAWLYHVPPP